jgi:hypothetical protein
MINVDPDGHVSVNELAATLEAVESTTAANLVDSAEEETIEGTTEGLGVEPTTLGAKAVGTAVPLTIYREPTEGLELEILRSDAFSPPCSSENEQDTSESFPKDDCVAAESDAPDLEMLEPIAIAPTLISNEATVATPIAGNAVLSANTRSNVDTIIRPLFDGALTFHDIRDAAAAAEYSWEVLLEPGQYIQLIDSRHVQIFYSSGHPAFAIEAQPAHDAVGTSVPTSLRVEGNVITETINHRSGSYVYPIIDGVGWEGGFTSTEIPGPMDEAEIREERERLQREERERLEREEQEAAEGTEQEGEPTVQPDMTGGFFKQVSFGPPVFVSDEGDEVPVRRRAYNFNDCAWNYNGTEIETGKGPAPLPPKERISELGQQCHGTKTNGYFTVRWAVSVSGVYLYKRDHWAWEPNGPDCRHWGPSQPATVHCKASSNLKQFPHVDVLGDFRFPPGSYQGSTASPGQATCYELDGVLPHWHYQDYTRLLQSTWHLFRDWVFPDWGCHWEHLRRVF